MKWLRSSHDKSGLNPLHAKERCCSASFLISLSVGYTGRDNRSHNSLRQQHLNQPLSAITTSKHHQVNILRCLLTCLAFLSYYQAYSQVLLAILGAFIQMMLLIETEEWSYVGLTCLNCNYFHAMILVWDVLHYSKLEHQHAVCCRSSRSNYTVNNIEIMHENCRWGGRDSAWTRATDVTHSQFIIVYNNAAHWGDSRIYKMHFVTVNRDFSLQCTSKDSLVNQTI